VEFSQLLELTWSKAIHTNAYIDIYTNAYSEANIVVDSLAFCLIGPQAIPSTTKIK